MASMSLQAAYDQARQSLESSDLDRAIGLAQHILDHYPDNLEAYRILGEAYLANRQLDRAQESFDRVLRSDPENIPAHVGLGITAERQGKLDRAIAEFEQALEIKPDMTELRSQLLRLYSEGFGSENAQLRLSRAGLARLYAKGHMLPQAINEFRQVISDQPGRFDAMVALAEALWRDGQEDEAISLCRDILAQRPESLKANLLLGYLLSSAGNPDGERFWQAGLRMDPYQGVAQALFETLPQESNEQPMIEEWDEAAWRSRRAAEQQEQIAATRPMEAVTPAGIPADVAAAADTGWHEPVAAPVAAQSAALPAETDDFLASLLALDSAPPPPASPAAPISEEELGLDADMQPFSLEDLDNPPAAPSAPAAPAAKVDDDDLTMTPFSLSDLGLSDEEIAGLESAGPPASSVPATPAEQADEDLPAMTPFSLSDLGLSDEEIAGLDSAGSPAPSAPTTPAEQADEDLPAMTPFSLSDLGLSDEEIAGLDSLQSERPGTAPSTPAEPSFGGQGAQDQDADAGDLPIDLQPFSFEDLDLNAESETSRLGGLPSSLQPFSLDEPPSRSRPSSFGSHETQENEGVLDDEPEAPAEPRGFSWQQASQKSESSFAKPPRPDPLMSEVSIFSKLKQQHNSQEPPPEQPLPPVSIEPDEHLGLFSLDDVSLREDTDQQTPPAAAPDQPAPTAPQDIENLQDALASGQVQPFSLSDLGLSEEEQAILEGRTPEAPASSAPPEPAAPAPEIENLQDALASGQVQPFSLSDLGLTPEELAMLEGGATSEEPAAPEADNVQDALASGQVQPFSLSDLGLSDDEIAAFGSAGGDAGGVAPAPEPPAQFAEFDVEPPAASSAGAQAPGNTAGEDESLLANDIKPFSLNDLGLSDEEIESLGLDAGASLDDTSDMSLGLTEEELEGLDGGDLKWALQPPAPATPADADAPAEQAGEQVTTGDLVVDRLIALGRQQGYIDISDIMANFEDPEAEAARIEEIGMRLHEANIEIRDGDEVIDMEAEYADEAEDTAPQAPEVPPPPRPALSRDLDLVTDDFDVPAPSEPAAEAPSEEPAMTPFSLSDLGLTEEEIAALGLGEAAPGTPAEATAADTGTPDPAAEAPSEEPAMTPFSLSDLGLTEEEIAALGLGEAAPGEQAPAPEAALDEPVVEHADQAPAEPEQAAPTPEPAAEAPSEEPAMTPFSLSDLGLTEEEIAALGLGEAAPGEQAPAPEAALDEPVVEHADQAPAEPEQAAPTPEAAPADAGTPEPAAEAPSEEPAMTPFSLSDLGLTEEEIAALGLGEAAPGEQVTPPSDTPADTADDAILNSLLSATDRSSAEVPPEQPPVAEPPAATAPAVPAEPEAPAQPAQSAPAVPAEPEVPAEPAQSAPAAPREAAKPAAPAEPASSSGGDVLNMFLTQLEAEPDNDVLRLSLARAGTQIGQTDVAMRQYRYLIRHSRLLDTVVGELEDLIADNDDAQVLQRLHRTLGDAYSKQGRLREAIEEYSWTLGGPRGAR